MARASGIRIVDYAKRQKDFNEETKPIMQEELNKLIDKIGYVNVICLLQAINGMQITDIDTPYNDKDYRNAWFSLTTKFVDKYGDNRAKTSGIEVLVDDKLQWRERWCDLIADIRFGMK